PVDRLRSTGVDGGPRAAEPKDMELISAPEAVRRFLGARAGRDAGPGVVVPTMGALHAGHGALIRAGAALARERRMPRGCVVTALVKPTQLNDPAAYAGYPRAVEGNAGVCLRAGADVLRSRTREDVSPPGRPGAVPPLPPQATEPGLED